MRLLTALLAAIGTAVAAVAAVFFFRKRRHGKSVWNKTTDTASSWSKTAAEKVGVATNAVADKVPSTH